jgi:succinyl-CoA synthetase beta subunit
LVKVKSAGVGGITLRTSGYLAVVHSGQSAFHTSKIAQRRWEVKSKSSFTGRFYLGFWFPTISLILAMIWIESSHPEENLLKIHEYQAKQIFSAYAIPVTPGTAVTTPAEALTAARSIGLPVAIKAQVLVGGRGKAGGVKIARTMPEVEAHAGTILGLTIKGLPVTKVFVTRAVDYKSELYLGLIVDRRTQKPVLMASGAGGVEIEEVARTTPERILKATIDPLIGLQAWQARNVGLALLHDARQANSLAAIAQKLYRVLEEKDCALVEINPLVVMEDDSLLALDAKIVLDDNALYRHPDMEALRDSSSEEPGEAAARNAGLSYVKLNGSIGCVVNGAGLAMATMDLIKRYGGEPANFLDIGGSSSPEKMAAAMKILLADRNVRAVLVNIFGGITRCDDVANGLLLAQQQIGIKVPIVARLIGTNQQQARELLSGSAIIFCDDMSEAVRRVNAEATRREATRREATRREAVK